MIRGSGPGKAPLSPRQLKGPLFVFKQSQVINFFERVRCCHRRRVCSAAVAVAPTRIRLRCCSDEASGPLAPHGLFFSVPLSAVYKPQSQVSPHRVSYFIRWFVNMVFFMALHSQYLDTFFLLRPSRPFFLAIFFVHCSAPLLRFPNKEYRKYKVQSKILNQKLKNYINK